MAYKLHKFDDVLLPVFDSQGDMGTGQVDSSLLDSIGGVFNYYGTTRRLPRKQIHQISGIYLGETDYEVDHLGNFIVDHLGNRIIAGLGPNRLQAQLDAITDKQGVQGTLWRIRQEDDVLQWKSARCLQVARPSVVTDVMRLASCTCVFETQQAAWRAASQSITNGTLINGHLGVNVHNDGPVTIRDAVIQITASGGSITGVTIAAPFRGIDLRFTGTLTDGQTLTIDCGAQTVRRANTNFYSFFALGSGHTARGWCPLAPGYTVFQVTSNQAGTVSFRRYNQYT